MKVTLFLMDRLCHFSLPEEVSGSFAFHQDDSDIALINIEERNGKWFLYSTNDVFVLVNQAHANEVLLEVNHYYNLEKKGQTYLIYIEDACDNTFNSYYYTNLNFSFGDSTNENFQLPKNLINNLKVHISKKEQGIVLEKYGNGLVYVNDYAVLGNGCLVNYGDYCNICGIVFLIIPGFVLINNPNGNVNFNSLNSTLSLNEIAYGEDPKDVTINDRDLYVSNDYYAKSPIVRRKIETKEFELSAPPGKGGNDEIPLILTIGPMLTMGLMSGTMLISYVQRITSGQVSIQNSWPQLLSSVAMLASMLVWPLVTQAYNKRRKRRREQQLLEKYTAYLDTKKKELIIEAEHQRDVLLEILLPVSECINIILTRSVYFWTKRLDQKDFLTVRMGMGNQKLDVDIKFPKEGFTIDEDALRKKAEILVDQFKYIKNVPVSYSFYDNKATCVMGGSYAKKIDFMNNLLVQLLAYYSYEDLKIVLFTNENRMHMWDYLRYLNHNFSDDKSVRFFATNSEEAKYVSNYMARELSIKKAYAEQGVSNNPPHYLIIVDDYDMVKKEEFINEICELDDNVGFSVVFLENRLSKLPSKCNNFISLNEKECGILRNSYEEQEQQTFMAEINPNLPLDTIGKVLANVPIEFHGMSQGLPEMITFMEMEKIGKVEQLAVLNRWNTSNSISTLRAEVGVGNDGDLMYLDLHEKAHGPHGLIAGMTGSGKSEFIITYILAMAVNYSPEDVSFILIDYKGGGLAFAFENKVNNIVLPHLAGVITNLDKSELDRTLVSIDSEIKRRQAIFNEARDNLGESTIDIYKYQRLYKEGKLSEPVSHLFIVCDEFAELKSQQPEFMDNLISVARIGRSLGVHLILATQKPSGVVNDQIWSNTKFRVCLKVQDESDSKEMLKKPDAAHLKQTGRFYLQVGYDEYFALGQSAWCGAKYYPSDKIVKQVDKSINFISNTGDITRSIQAATKMKVEAKGEQLAAILNNVIEVAKMTNKKAKRLWLPNIPDIIYSNDIMAKYGVTPSNYQICLGEYDAPEKQEQNLVVYDALEQGNTLIYGNDGVEREHLLTTLVHNMASSYSSSEVNMYIMDYGSESFRRFASLPHVGGLVFAGDDEKYHNMLKLLKEELKRRKQLFVDYGGEYKNYIASGNELPLIMLIINNYDALRDMNPNAYDELPEVMADSARYGIVHFISCNAVNSIPNKITQLFTNIYAFKLKDKSDYMSLFSVRSKVVPSDIFGRGVLNNDGLHEFQVASVAPAEELNDYLLNFVKKMKEKNQISARKIPALPDIVRLQDVYNHTITLKTVPLGISKSSLDVVYNDFTYNIGNIVTSTKLINTKKFILSLIQEFTLVPNLKFMLFDPLMYMKEIKNAVTKDFDETLKNFTRYLEKKLEEKSNESGVVIIYGLSRFVSKVDRMVASDFFKILKKYEKYILIAVDDAPKIKKFAFEAWYTDLFSNSDGIWIGRGVGDQSLIHISSLKKEMMLDYKNDMGFVVNDGLANLTKLIDFISEEGDVNNDE